MCFGLSAYCMSPKSQIRKSTEECRIFSNFDLTSDTLYSPLCISYLCKWGGVGSTVVLVTGEVREIPLNTCAPQCCWAAPRHMTDMEALLGPHYKMFKFCFRSCSNM